MKRFREKLDAAVQQSGSLLCIGLDPDIRQFPTHLASLDPFEAIVESNRQIVDATSDEPFDASARPGGTMFYTSGTTGRPKGVKRGRASPVGPAHGPCVI